MNCEDKDIFYQHATNDLLNKLNMMNLSKDDKKRAGYFIRLFRDAFKRDSVKKDVFVTPRNVFWRFDYDSAGFCYVSSVVFSVVTGVQNWNLMYIDSDKWSVQIPHYYLQHVKSRIIFDLTYDQFSVKGLNIPYEIGEHIQLSLDKDDASFRFAKALNINFENMLKKSDIKVRA